MPRELFVAWNGVLTLAYEGFPPELATVKSKLNSRQVELGLKEEGFGSRWPKTTLAALNDAALAFTLEELQRLQALCKQHSVKLLEARGVTVPVTALSVVEYQARSLEAPRMRLDLPLLPRSELGEVLSDMPSEEERARVQSVLAAGEDSATYLPKVNAPGSRASSYHEASPSGVTCVVFWGEQPELEPLRIWLRGFQQAVDAAFPGVYSWVDEGSLHCTVRSLDTA